MASIKQWSKVDRPREKLLQKGKHALSNAELLAILIGSGNRKETAVGLCKRILGDNDNKLSELRKLQVQQFMQYIGIGEAKAISIIAALELGHRRRFETASEIEKIESSASVYQLMQPIFTNLPHEEFWVLYLNQSNSVIQKHLLSKGGITETTVDVRLVLKMALQVGAVSLIFVHNHPSGQLKPSQADVAVTHKLITASESMDIKVLDHLILTEKAYFSFADEDII